MDEKYEKAKEYLLQVCRWLEGCATCERGLEDVRGPMRAELMKVDWLIPAI